MVGTSRMRPKIDSRKTRVAVLLRQGRPGRWSWTGKKEEASVVFHAIDPLVPCFSHRVHSRTRPFSHHLYGDQPPGVIWHATALDQARLAKAQPKSVRKSNC